MTGPRIALAGKGARIMTNATNQAVKSLRIEQREQRKAKDESSEKQLDKALRDSFPASDPAAPVTPTKAGAPNQRKS